MFQLVHEYNLKQTINTALIMLFQTSVKRSFTGCPVMYIFQIKMLVAVFFILLITTCLGPPESCTVVKPIRVRKGCSAWLSGDNEMGTDNSSNST